MDYRKLNKATKKDHFPLPFIDQILNRLVGVRILLFHISIWNICFQKDALWNVQCTRNILKIHDAHLLKHVGKWSGNFYRLFFSIWKYLWLVPQNFRQSFEKMWKHKLSVELREMSLHGNRSNWARTWSLTQWPRGGPSKSISNWKVTTTNQY